MTTAQPDIHTLQFAVRHEPDIGQILYVIETGAIALHPPGTSLTQCGTLRTIAGRPVGIWVRQPNAHVQGARDRTVPLRQLVCRSLADDSVHIDDESTLGAILTVYRQVATWLALHPQTFIPTEVIEAMHRVQDYGEVPTL